MATGLGAELTDLLSVDVEALPIVDLPAYLARLERARSRFEAEALDRLAAFDASRAWHLDASRNAAHWLAGQIGTSKIDARRRVDLARHLQHMPRTVAALRSGQITVEHARAMTACVANERTAGDFPWYEDQLLESARTQTADELTNTVRRWIELMDQDGPEPRPAEPDVLHASRVGDRVKLDGDFCLDTGLPLLEALKERTDQLFRRDGEVIAANPEDPLRTRTPGNRRAEALFELVMAGSGDECNPSHREPLYNVHVDHLTLLRLKVQADSIHELDDGSVIPIGTLAVWRCDAIMSRVVLDARQAVLNYGRTERYANRALRRALAARDRGCAVPGCDRPPEHCDAHHVVFWEDSGGTDIDNLVLLCRHHHRMIHAEDLRVELIDGRPRFYDRFDQLLEKGRRRRPPASAA